MNETNLTQGKKIIFASWVFADIYLLLDILTKSSLLIQLTPIAMAVAIIFIAYGLFRAAKECGQRIGISFLFRNLFGYPCLFPAVGYIILFPIVNNLMLS
jgi:hypothetical protein